MTLDSPIQGEITKPFKKQQISQLTPSLRATASLELQKDASGNYDGKTITLTSTDGTAVTYVFDDDDDGATGTTDGDGFTRIQINGLSDKTSCKRKEEFCES